MDPEIWVRIPALAKVPNETLYPSTLNPNYESPSRVLGIGSLLTYADELGFKAFLLWRRFSNKIRREISKIGLEDTSALVSAEKFVAKLFRPTMVKIDGQKLYLQREDNVIAPVILRYGIWERRVTESFKSLITKGSTVADVGAHIGYYTLIASKYVGKSGRVFAFEPHPKNFAFLLKNIRANACDNVIPVQAAISNLPGTVKLFINPNNVGGHRLWGESRDKFLWVKATTLDDFFKEYDYHVDLIKMDIEGLEGAAIQGMPVLLRKNSALTIFSEYWPGALKASGLEPEEYLLALSKNRFKLYEIIPGKGIEETSAASLLQKYTSAYAHTNLLCMRG